MKNWEGHKEIRLFNSMRNTFWNFIGQLVLVFVGLFLKRVLLQTLGTEKIGINYLFNDIVTLLSIAELGLTGIIAYHLYNPLAKENHNKVKQLMDFFKKSYAVLGLILTLVGFGIIPFLSILVGETTLPFDYISIVFILFLLRSVEGYFLSYKQLLLYADQKHYIITIIDIVTTIIYSVLSIVVLLYTKNFIYVILLEVIKKTINDLIIIGIVNKKYPYITMKNIPTIEKTDIKQISVDIKNVFVSKLSQSIIDATDNIVISIYLGITTTGLFSNYAMVLKTIETVLFQLIQSVQASVGNLLVDGKGEVIHSVLQKITFICFFMASISGSCLIQLTTPFVALWFGTKYVMVEAIVWVCVFNIFLHVMQLGVMQYSNARGLFKQTKKIDLVGCIFNVVLSIIGIQIMGIVGVFLATFISRSIEFVFRIKLVYKEVLEIEYAPYIKKILGYMLVFILEIIIVLCIGNIVNISNVIIEFIVLGMIAIIVPFMINIIVYYSTDDFQYMIYILKTYMKQK